MYKLNRAIYEIIAGFAFSIVLFPAPLLSSEIYEYDAQGRLTKVTYGDSMSIAYTYDNNSNILTVEIEAPVTSVAERQSDLLPKVFALQQNYPNPFNPSTTIKYQLPAASEVKITIYNLLGREVRTLVDAEKPAGFYSVDWDGLNEHGLEVASGIYLYRIEAKSMAGEKFLQTKKLMLLK